MATPPLGVLSPLPEDKVFQIFSYCNVQTLGRLACVCKPFRRISEDNTLWQTLFRWNFQVNLEDLSVKKWKTFYRRADSIDFREIDPDWDDSEIFWSKGLPRQAISKFANNPGSHWIAPYHAIMKMPLPAIPVKGKELHHVLGQILELFETNLEQAFSLYIAHRDEFIKSYPELGGWLSMLFQQFRPQKMLKDQKIFAPGHLKNKDKVAEFLQGVSIIWLDKGKTSHALCTFQYLTFLQNKISNLSNQTHEDWNFYRETIILGVYMTPFVQSLELLGDTLSEIDDYENMAIEAYVKALGHFLTLQDQIRIVVSLCAVLSENKKNVSPKILNLPVTIFTAFASSKLNPLNISSLDILNRTALIYQLTDLHHLLLKESSLPQYQNVVTSEAASFYFSKYGLCIVANEPRLAIRTWIMLCECLTRNNENKHLNHLREKLFRRIYNVLDQSPEAREEIIHLRTSCRLAKVGLAYALHVNGQSERALQIMAGLAHLIDPKEINWVFELSKTRFEALLVYSLSLHTEDEIDAYFMNFVDNIYFEGSKAYIYYNMAVRLHFEGHHFSALECLDAATQLGLNEPELFVLQGLCHRSLEQPEEEATAFQNAESFNPAYTSNREYSELDLLIFKVTKENKKTG